MIYTFNAGVVSSITANVTIVTSESIRINSITLNGRCTSTTQAGSVAITIRDSTDSTNTYTETIGINAGEDFSITFNPSFVTAHENATVTISTVRTRATVYGGSRQESERYIQGLGAYINSANMYNCTVDMELNNTVWVSASGGVELVENPYELWNGWPQDEDGYPINVAVWKADSNNDGYAWIIGFKKQKPSGQSVEYIKQPDGTLKPYFVYLKTENGLVPVTEFVKTENGLVPVTG